MSQNLLKIYDGRTSFWQWDKGQKFVILSDSVTEVHLSHKGVNSSKELEIKTENDMRVCDIPDVFLQIPKNIVVYAVHSREESEHTITSIEIAVKLRSKPDGYYSVHDDEYSDFNARLTALEDRTIESSVTKTEVEKYIGEAIEDTLNIDDHGVAILDGGTIIDKIVGTIQKYVHKLRRGTAQQWIDYEASGNYQKPHEGELVVEYNDGIPTIKVGDGVRDYSELPSISVDSVVLPTKARISIKGGEANWILATDQAGNSLGYRKQAVVVEGATVTPNSKIDLQLTTDELVAFYAKSLAFMVENDNCNVSVVCVGQVPQNDWTFRATVTEVVVDG